MASGADATAYRVTSGKIRLRLPDLSNETSLVGRIEVDIWKGLRTHRVSVPERGGQITPPKDVTIQFPEAASM